MSEKVSVFIPIRLKERLDDLKRKLHLDEEALLQSLLNEAIQEKEIEIAIKEYQKGRVTLGEAVLLAKIDYWSFLDILHERKIAANIDENDHIKEIEKIKQGDYKDFL